MTKDKSEREPKEPKTLSELMTWTIAEVELAKRKTWKKRDVVALLKLVEEGVHHFEGKSKKGKKR